MRRSINTQGRNKMTVNAIPEGYNTITPYMIVNDSKKFIQFVENAFGGKLNHNMQADDGTTMHAEMQIGNSKIMISEASKKNPATPIMLYLYLEDVDGIYAKALAAGAMSVMAPNDTFYGDRNAGIQDHSGNKWWIAKHIRDVTEEELAIGAKKKQEELKQAK